MLPTSNCTVELSYNGQQFADSAVMIEVYELILNSTTPSVVPTTFSTAVTVSGQFFVEAPTLICRFNSAIVPASYISNSSLVCRTPSSLPAGPVSVAFSPNGGYTWAVMARFVLTARDIPSISSVSPVIGLPGDLITIMGNNFVQPMIRFQSSLQTLDFVNCTTVSQTRLTCSIPGQSSLGQSYLLYVSNDGGYNWFPSAQHIAVNSIPAGHYAVEWVTTVSRCSPGEYCPHNNTMAPKRCPPGTFVNRSQQIQCSVCPRGYYCPGSGRTAPIACDAGYVCAETGLDRPVQFCPSGYWCPPGVSVDIKIWRRFQAQRPQQFGTFRDSGFRKQLMYIERNAGVYSNLTTRVNGSRLNVDWDHQLGTELFVYNSTSGRNQLLLDLNPSGSSNITIWTGMGPNRFVFTAFNGVGFALYSAAATALSAPITLFTIPAPISSVTYWTNFNGYVFYSIGRQLWQTDAIQPSTLLFTLASAPTYLCTFRGRIYFSVASSLHATDGISDFTIGAIGQNPESAGAIFGTEMLLVADGLLPNGTAVMHGSIWKSDGTSVSLMEDMASSSGVYNLHFVHERIVPDPTTVASDQGMLHLIYLVGDSVRSPSPELYEISLLAANRITSYPQPCPAGFYCPPGVQYGAPNMTFSNIAVSGSGAYPDGSSNLYRSQPIPDRPVACRPGFWCGPASETSQGDGACPTGHYCPNGIAIPCPAGTFCPGVGNTRPIRCYRGTYNPLVGQSICQYCPFGMICPDPSQSPLTCPPGFVCDDLRLASPPRPCPPCYVCDAGTVAMPNTTFGQLLQEPRPCPAGHYCIEGVSSAVHQYQNYSTPQLCSEGYYCEVGSCSPTGTAICPPGYYCPEGSSAPILAGFGKYSRQVGEITPELCPPGYFSGVNDTFGCWACPKGYSCAEEGTVTPAICPAGRYREDDIKERYCLACPEGRYGLPQGQVSVDNCTVCSAGWVCGTEGRTMPPEVDINLLCPPGHVCPNGTTQAMSQEFPCPGGYYCPAGTSPSTQFDHICPAGFYCFNRTSDESYPEFPCEPGYYCPAGMWIQPSALGTRFRCPLGTTSVPGARSITSCIKDCQELRFCEVIASINPIAGGLAKFTVEPLEMAIVQVDWSNKPYIKFDDHFFLAIRVNGRPEAVQLPSWFWDDPDPYKQIPFNIYLYAVRPIQVTVTIELFNGFYIDEMFKFKDTVNITTFRPTRSNMDPLAKSYDFAFYAVLEKDTFDQLQLELPLNLPLENNTEVFIDVGLNETYGNIGQLQENLTVATQTPAYWVTGFQGETDRVVVPLHYFPFVKDCKRFSTHIPVEYAISAPESCTRPDTVVPVRSFDVGLTGQSDVCDFSTTCEIEEELRIIRPRVRWFELDTDKVMFYMTRDPTSNENYFQGYKYFQNLIGTDSLVPVTVTSDRPNSDLLYLPGYVAIQLQYYQRTPRLRRLIQAKVNLTNWIEVPSFVVEQVMSNNKSVGWSSTYEFHVIWTPMNWFDLMNSFSFGLELYTVLFCAVGLAAFVAISALFLINRAVIRTKSPPPFRFFPYFEIVIPSPFLGGFCIMISIGIIILFIYVLFGLMYPFGAVNGNYQNTADLTDATTLTYKTGRLGVSLLAFGFCVLIQGSRLMVSRRSDRHPRSSELWNPITWRRIQIVLYSVMVSLLLLYIFEFSYTTLFANNTFAFIIVMKVIGNVLEMVLGGLIEDATMTSPMMVSLMIAQFVVTVGAADLFSFVLSYTVDLAFLAGERVYINPIGKYFFQRLPIIWGRFQVKALRREKKDAAAAILEKKIALMEEELESQTIEPMIDSFCVYANDTIALILSPITLFLIVLFNKESQMPTNYGMTSSDLLIYLLFSCVIIGWQFGIDVVLLNLQELFHTWPVYDYVEFARYRFRIRQTRWKPDEAEIDTTLEPEWQKLDQLCFSSQFYFMAGFHAFGIVTLVFGYTIMLRSSYAAFADQLSPIVIGFTIFTCMIFRELFCIGADWAQLWYLPKKEADDEADAPELSDYEEKYDIRKNIATEAVRLKFLKFNKLWLLHHLTSVLTPRSIERNRPYLIEQYEQLIRQQADGHFDNVNEVSSDSDGLKSDEEKKAEIYLGERSESTKQISSWWLDKARRHIKLRSLVMTTTYAQRKGTCEQCANPQNLTVEQLVPFIEVVDAFDRLLADPTFMAGTSENEKWRMYFQQNQTFRTRCRKCITKDTMARPARTRSRLPSGSSSLLLTDRTAAASRRISLKPDTIVEQSSDPAVLAAVTGPDPSSDAAKDLEQRSDLPSSEPVIVPTSDTVDVPEHAVNVPDHAVDVVPDQIALPEPPARTSAPPLPSLPDLPPPVPARKLAPLTPVVARGGGAGPPVARPVPVVVSSDSSDSDDGNERAAPALLRKISRKATIQPISSDSDQDGDDDDNQLKRERMQRRRQLRKKSNKVAPSPEAVVISSDDGTSKDEKSNEKAAPSPKSAAPAIVAVSSDDTSKDEKSDE